MWLRGQQVQVFPPILIGTSTHKALLLLDWAGRYASDGISLINEILINDAILVRIKLT